MSYGTPVNNSNKYVARYQSNATPGIEVVISMQKTFDFTEAQYDAAFQDFFSKVDPISGWTLAEATKTATEISTVTP